MKIRTIIVTIAIFGMLGSPLSAHADLIGDTIHVSRFTDTNTFYDAMKVVGAGVEINDDIPGLFELDVTADSLVFTAFGVFKFSDLVPPALFYEWLFDDLDWGVPGGIVGLNFVNWDVLGLDTNRASFTANSVTIDINNFKPTFWEIGDTWTIELVHGVPEPGSLALLGIGLLGMRLARRKKKV